MAMTGPGGGGGRRSRTRNAGGFNEINVTPFVDVMLVLLIIFMVAAPMMTTGVQVDLPKAKSAGVEGNDKPLAVSVKSDGTIYLQETEVTLEELGPKLQAISQENTEARIFVRGDTAIDYGRIMQVVGEINGAGFSKVALLTNMVDAPKPR